MADTRTTILKVSTQLFAAKGYEGVSMRNIADEVKISAPALYNHFKDKRSLYLTAISETFEKKSEQYISVIEGQGGCLFGNCAVEFSNSDQLVLNQVTNGMQQLQEMFVEVIEIGQRKGDVPKDKSAQAIASNLVATYYGIQTMAKAGLSLDALKQVISQALLQLD